MIPLIQLKRSQLVTSKLALGLSRLHYLSAPERQRLLASAADVGFRHFDAARSYGDGLAELELGRFLRGQRSRFVIATKYGLPANRLIEKYPALGQPLRVLRGAAGRLKLRAQGAPILRAPDLAKSIVQSLRALQTDVIDIFFFHEPSLSRLSRPHDLAAEVERQKQKGSIRFVGLSGTFASTLEVAQAVPALADVIQVPEPEWSETGVIPDLTFGAIRPGPQSRFEPSLDPVWAVQQLSAALRRRAAGAVVVSTTRADHLASLAAVAEANQ